MIIAIGLQESGFLHRRQQPTGPARSFFQFELIGIVGLCQHHRSTIFLRDLCERMSLEFNPETIHEAIEHNDVLAIACARRLLAQSPQSLPGRDEPERAWQEYLKLWRPGQPRPAKWGAYWQQAWEIVEGN